MNFTPRILPIIICCVAAAGVAHAESADIDLLIEQLRGSNCSYDSNCKSQWSWWARFTTRRPEYRCRMAAASCLSKLGSRGVKALSVLEQVRKEMPAEFDTGDGVIMFGDCIDSTIAKLKGQNWKSQNELLGDCL